MENTKPTAEEYISQVSWQAYSTLGYDIVVDRKDALEACKLSRSEAIEEILDKAIEEIGATKEQWATSKPSVYVRDGLNIAIMVLNKLKGEK
jgi:tRNA pseudouridine-54 N-methylase